MRRDAGGGAVDQAVVVVSNAHVLAGIVFPPVTTALGIAGSRSVPEHPCMLAGPTPLPGGGLGIPTLPDGNPAATVFVDFLLGQVDASGLRLDVTLRAVSWGGFATVTMRALVRTPITAAISSANLTIALGTPSITTTTNVSVDAAVYLLGFAVLGIPFAGPAVGFPLLAATAAVDLFGGGFIDSFIRDRVVSVLPPLTPQAIPLAGSVARLNVDAVQTSEAGAPARSRAGVFLDRVNDVVIRML